MKSSFDANLPRRKPRTRLSTMLAEIDAPQEPEQGAASSDATSLEDPPSPDVDGPPPHPFMLHVTHDTTVPLSSCMGEAQPVDFDSRPVLDTVAHESVTPTAKAEADSDGSENSEVSDTSRSSDSLRMPGDSCSRTGERESPSFRPSSHESERANSTPVAAASTAHGAAAPRVFGTGTAIGRSSESRGFEPPVASQGVDDTTDVHLSNRRARIVALRERLRTTSSRPAPAPAEPRETASRIKETVSSLHAQLDRAHEEKLALEAALIAARSEIDAFVERVEVERAAKESAQALAAERMRVADALALEAEALADERDQALRRISEFKDIEIQQTELLAEFEAALKDRALEIKRHEAEVNELQGALGATVFDLESVQARLEAEAVENRALRHRIASLEAEVQRSAQATSALHEIQDLVERSVGRDA